MELHTLGVDGVLPQKDVTEGARCFTGGTSKNLVKSTIQVLTNVFMIPIRQSCSGKDSLRWNERRRTSHRASRKKIQAAQNLFYQDRAAICF